MGCPFCSLENEGYRIVWENKYAVAMLNWIQLAEGQMMVLPRRHVEVLSELTPAEAVAYNALVQKCMDYFDDSPNHDSPMCFLQGWKFRSQRHLHCHIIPSKGSWIDYVTAELPRDLPKPSPSTIEELEVIRDKLLQSK